MSNDSTFQDDQTQGSVPSRPEPDEPLLNPNDPGKYDPLTRPDTNVGEQPQEWDDPAGRGVPEADEQTPLSDDRR